MLATTSTRRAARRTAAILTKLRPATAGLTAARRVALAATAVLAVSAVAVVKVTRMAAAMDARASPTNTRASLCPPRASTAGIPAARRVALAPTAVLAECAVAVVKITSKVAATGRLASTLTTRAFSPAAIPRVPRAKQARPSPSSSPSSSQPSSSSPRPSSSSTSTPSPRASPTATHPCPTSATATRPRSRPENQPSKSSRRPDEYERLLRPPTRRPASGTRPRRAPPPEATAARYSPTRRSRRARRRRRRGSSSEEPPGADATPRSSSSHRERRRRRHGSSSGEPRRRAARSSSPPLSSALLLVSFCTYGRHCGAEFSKTREDAPPRRPWQGRSKLSHSRRCEPPSLRRLRGARREPRVVLGREVGLEALELDGGRLAAELSKTDADAVGSARPPLCGRVQPRLHCSRCRRTSRMARALRALRA